MSEVFHPGGLPVVLFTVDTEPDRQWFDHHVTSTENILHLPRLQRLFDELGVIPTYLATYAVATSRAAVQMLKQLQRNSGAEIGAHLHVWDTPPLSPESWCDRYPAFAHELPLGQVQAKLEQLTAVLGEAFGGPTAYRAGRFGFAAAHIPLLESLGYQVDSSVTPLIDRRRKQGVPFHCGGHGGRDYRRAPLDPYYPDYGDDLKPGEAKLLEVPLTAGPTRQVGRTGLAVHRNGPELLQRVMRKLSFSEVVSASPVHYSEEQLRAMLVVAIGEGRKVFNFMLHSSEALPGASPSIRSESDLEELLHRTRRIISWLRAQMPFTSCGLSALARRHGRRQANGCPALENTAR